MAASQTAPTMLQLGATAAPAELLYKTRDFKDKVQEYIEVLEGLFTERVGEEGEACRLCLKELQAGLSGSLVLQATWTVMGRPLEPCIVKLDKAASLAEEHKFHTEAQELLKEYVPRVIGQYNLEATGDAKGGVAYELAGACWFMHELMDLDDQVTVKSLKDKYKKEEARQTMDGLYTEWDDLLWGIYSEFGILSRFHPKSGDLGAIWLIDFDKLAWHHVLRDIAKMMSIVLFQYTLVAELAELTALMQLVEHLFEDPQSGRLSQAGEHSSKFSLHQLPDFAPACCSPKLRLVRYTLRQLWGFASALVARYGPSAHPLDSHAVALWVPLLMYAIKTLHWHATSDQKRVALHVARILARRIAALLENPSLANEQAERAKRQPRDEPLGSPLDGAVWLARGQRVEVCVLGTWHAGVVDAFDISARKHIFKDNSPAGPVDLSDGAVQWRLLPRFPGCDAGRPRMGYASWALHTLPSDAVQEVWSLQAEHASAGELQGGSALLDGVYVVLRRPDLPPLPDHAEDSWEWSLHVGEKEMAPSLMMQARGSGSVCANAGCQLTPGWLLVHASHSRWLRQESADAPWELRPSRADRSAGDGLHDITLDKAVLPVKVEPLSAVFMYRHELRVAVVQGGASQPTKPPGSAPCLWEGVISGFDVNSGGFHVRPVCSVQHCADQGLLDISHGVPEFTRSRVMGPPQGMLSPGSSPGAAAAGVGGCSGPPRNNDVDVSSAQSACSADSAMPTSTRPFCQAEWPTVGCGLAVTLSLTNHIVLPEADYGPGTSLFVPTAFGGWTTATTRRPTTSAESTLRLGYFGHASRLMACEDFAHARRAFRRSVVASHSTITDLLSGCLLDTKKHLMSLTLVELEALQPLWTSAARDRASKLGLEELDDAAAAADAHMDESCAFQIGSFFDESPADRSTACLSPCTYLLIAGPAMGKSTLMRQVALQCAESSSSPFVPILIPAADLAKKMSERASTVSPGVINDYLHAVHGGGSWQYRFLCQVLRMRQALILIDGLDEAGGMGGKIEEWICEHLALEGHRVVLTSRPGGVRLERVSPVMDVALKLEPLTVEQQNEMVKKRICAGDQADALVQELASHRDISGNPLMLSLLISVYQRHSALPEKSLELYRTVLKGMTEGVERKHRKGRMTEGLPSGGGNPGSPEVSQALRRVAFHHHRRAQRQITSSSVAEALAGSGFAETTGWQAVLRAALCGHFAPLTVLKHEAEGWELMFSHLTFQEYFCAELMAEVLSGPDGAEELPPFEELLNEQRWWRVLEFLRDGGHHSALVAHYGDLAQELAHEVKHHPALQSFCGIPLARDLLEAYHLPEVDLSSRILGLLGTLVLADVLPQASLGTLKVPGNNIEADGAKALTVALTPNEEGVFSGSLNTLDLGENQIGPEGAKALAVALTPNAEGVFNTSLNTLSLAGNGIRLVNDIGPEGAKALAVALTPNEEGVFNTSLNTLDLGQNGIEDEGAKALAVALTPNAEGVVNTSLNTLNVWRNAVQLEGARALVDAVKQRNAPIKLNGSLLDVEALDLTYQRLKPEDALLLANDLVFNGSLNTLNLWFNKIGDEGAKALAVALTPNAEGVFNTSLNSLYLACENLQTFSL
ncbi:hypothetical protein CYMTET_48824 [Cymbomonas tetramitiformis]|uniref:NACHT domain-containing protein n=1 Tax=Cymbomonas tetramitiformis TaxID=36881 RepID=A0AAE0BRF6_9CHLO|nr:hypothetical protein CYMTET_48824 [Cymbomonas tetramitiformis]